MIMYTFENMLAVTNRKLCAVPFLEQVERLASFHPAGILLREKDLNEAEYEALARQVLEVCQKQKTTCIIHSWPQTARRLGCKNLHLPMESLRRHAGELSDFTCLGASVHSAAEALEAQKLGATYVTAGHVFLTDCKKGMPPRGLGFLREVCETVDIPVYGIGGVDQENFRQILEQGAAGYCVMSQAMRL